MKTVVSRASLVFRLGVSTAALLLAQQAFAVGTDAGVTVSNQATVAYDVNSVVQTPIDSDPLGNSTPGAGSTTDFVVDRRVDFVFTAADALPTEIRPGDTDAIAAFSLTNESNAIMDFSLSLVDLASGAVVNGFTDSGDVMANYRIRVANTDGAAGVPDLADLPYVDELGEDATVVIYVFADDPGGLSNGDVDNWTLNATAADDPLAAATLGSLDPLLLETPGADDPTLIENVFANPSGADDPDPLLGNATEGIDDGYDYVSAELTITKTALVISDPFGSGKALPDAVIEYTVTIANAAGADPAQSIVLTDGIQIPDVVFEDEAYGVDQDVSINGAFCNADPGDLLPAPDGCAYDPGTGALSIDVPDVLGGATTIITYQVRISTL